jgi:hypothetical protein
MSEASWQFNTTIGVVTVREDTIAVRSTPGYFLAGQRSHWRHGGRWERAKLLFSLGGLLSSGFGIAFHLSQVGPTGLGVQSAPHVLALVLFLFIIWSNHIGEQTIPLSAVDTITLDEDEGTLVITHERAHDYLSVFRDEEVETTLSIPTADNVREAKEIFRLRDIELGAPDADEGGTTYRVRTRNGACFCERCHSQVSPSDSTCPACGYAIRVQSGAEDVSEPASMEAENRA